MNPQYAQYYGREYIPGPPTQQPSAQWFAPAAVRRFFRAVPGPQPAQAPVVGLVAPATRYGGAATLTGAAPPPASPQSSRPYALLRAPTMAESVYGLGG
jgi:hypothetical protein